MRVIDSFDINLYTSVQKKEIFNPFLYEKNENLHIHIDIRKTIYDSSKTIIHVRDTLETVQGTEHTRQFF